MCCLICGCITVFTLVPMIGPICSPDSLIFMCCQAAIFILTLRANRLLLASSRTANMGLHGDFITSRNGLVTVITVGITSITHCRTRRICLIDDLRIYVLSRIKITIGSSTNCTYLLHTTGCLTAGMITGCYNCFAIGQQCFTGFAIGITGIAGLTAGCFLGLSDFCITFMVISIEFTIGSSTRFANRLCLTGGSAAGMISGCINGVTVLDNHATFTHRICSLTYLITGRLYCICFVVIAGVISRINALFLVLIATVEANLSRHTGSFASIKIMLITGISPFTIQISPLSCNWCEICSICIFQLG